MILYTVKFETVKIQYFSVVFLRFFLEVFQEY